MARRAPGSSAVQTSADKRLAAWRAMVGTEWPLVQAPMAGAQGHALAVAVCNAGGLGSLPGAMLGHAALRQELQALCAGTTRPWNINFFCHTPPVLDAAQAAQTARWREALAPYQREFGVEPRADAGSGTGLGATPAPTRLPFDDSMADVLEPFSPAVVSFHFGLPPPALLARVKGWGTRVWSTATTVDEGRWLQARGVDAVIAQGLEAGGHRGHFLREDLSLQAGTLALVPQLVQALHVPVIAAGGVADAQGVQAALALGAMAVQVGTAYLLCPEASTSALHRAALHSEQARHTALTNLFSGRPARGIVNRLMRELGPLSPLAPAFPLASADLAPLRAAAEARGSSDFSPLWAGQNTSGCRPVGAAEITRALALGTRAT